MGWREAGGEGGGGVSDIKCNNPHWEVGKKRAGHFFVFASAS